MNPSDIDRISARIAALYTQRKARFQETISSGQKEISTRISSSLNLIAKHAEMELQDKIRDLIPIDNLHSKARELMTNKKEDQKDFNFYLIKSVLNWFKTEFFKWVDKPCCNDCKSFTEFSGMGQPTPTESYYGAGNVEIYKCQSCNRLERFPRYNE
jgi:peptide-N4-(N-acetyl-beta-glucosaminyl)asparagine amidase